MEPEGPSGEHLPVGDDAPDLRASLEIPDAQGFARSGYTEFLEADGTITYAQPFEGGSGGYVILVSVVPVDGGWAVDQWERSGC